MKIQNNDNQHQKNGIFHARFIYTQRLSTFRCLRVSDLATPGACYAIQSAFFPSALAPLPLHNHSPCAFNICDPLQQWTSNLQAIRVCILDSQLKPLPRMIDPRHPTHSNSFPPRDDARCKTTDSVPQSPSLPLPHLPSFHTLSIVPKTRSLLP